MVDFGDKRSQLTGAEWLHAPGILFANREHVGTLWELQVCQIRLSRCFRIKPPFMEEQEHAGVKDVRWKQFQGV